MGNGKRKELSGDTGGKAGEYGRWRKLSNSLSGSFSDISTNRKILKDSDGKPHHTQEILKVHDSNNKNVYLIQSNIVGSLDALSDCFAFYQLDSNWKHPQLSKCLQQSGL